MARAPMKSAGVKFPKPVGPLGASGQFYYWEQQRRTQPNGGGPTVIPADPGDSEHWDDSEVWNDTENWED